MSYRRIFVLILLLVLAFSARAEKITLLGRVGDFPVAVTLNKNGDRLEGWYFYLSRAKQIRLEGTLTQDGRFHLDETPNPGSKVITGLFDGTVGKTNWSGNWKKNPDGPPLPLDLQSSTTDFANTSIRVQCTIQEPEDEAHVVLRSQLKLDLSAGEVSQFSVEQSASYKGKEENSCGIRLDDLEPMPSTSGLALRADNEDPDSKGGGCTVRLVGNERLLWIEFDDSSREGDDCRRTEEVMFCSARGAWRDLVLDRQTGKCKFLK